MYSYAEDRIVPLYFTAFMMRMETKIRDIIFLPWKLNPNNFHLSSWGGKIALSELR